MKKQISFVVTLFNEENSVKGLLKSFDQLDITDYEVEFIFYNDGSTDDTVGLLKEWKERSKKDVMIIDNIENKGRAIGRKVATEKAKYETICITDGKCEVYPDVLQLLKSLDQRVIIGNVIEKTEKIIPKVLALFRSFLYKPYWGEDFQDIEITIENFDKIPKGTTFLICPKKLFLESQPEDLESKYVNEDTKIFRIMIETVNLYKSHEIKVLYNTRQGFKENIKHLFERGPRFINYYFDKPGKYGAFLRVFPFLIIALITLSCIVKGFSIGAFLVVVSFHIVISFLIGRKIYNSILFFIISPILIAAFISGLLVGYWIKLINIFSGK